MRSPLLLQINFDFLVKRAFINEIKPFLGMVPNRVFVPTQNYVRRIF